MRCHLGQPPRVCLSYCRDGGLLRKSSLVSMTAQHVGAGMLDATVDHGRPPRRQAAPAPERALLRGSEPVIPLVRNVASQTGFPWVRPMSSRASGEPQTTSPYACGEPRSVV